MEPLAISHSQNPVVSWESSRATAGGCLAVMPFNITGPCAVRHQRLVCELVFSIPCKGLFLWVLATYLVSTMNRWEDVICEGSGTLIYGVCVCYEE